MMPSPEPAGRCQGPGVGPYVVRSLAQARPRVRRGGSPRLRRLLWSSLGTSRSPRICAAGSSQASCPPGARLKTEEELREEYGQDKREVSRNIVRDAIKLLVSRGLFEARPRRGTFGGKWSRLSSVWPGTWSLAGKRTFTNRRSSGRDASPGDRPPGRKSNWPRVTSPGS